MILFFIENQVNEKKINEKVQKLLENNKNQWEQREWKIERSL